ncbi:MAG: VacJ family lipoprotein [Proteobacteria bacterium]|nr:VacJ family lipoprotein [Pseudomonadota bacterium]NIS70706.1 VacJ family lipoprotein [Pseudomonadota bacterium]
MTESYRKRSPGSVSRSSPIRCWTVPLLIIGFLFVSNLSLAGTLPSFRRSSASISILQVDPAVQFAEVRTDNDAPSFEEPIPTIPDPLEPINRVFFHVNDRIYFWALKPVATGYRTVIALPIRLRVRDFFSNASAPIRVANCLLQLKFKGAATETVRFVLNTTVGVVGFYDIAKKGFNIDRREEDFGQTLGFYGIGPIFYINWPFFGPSSLRDVVGIFGDFFLDPWNYLFKSPVLVNIAIGGYERVNNTSLTLGEYEDLKEAALDPYVALRDAYHQFRETKIDE